jgi:hypothetical protein
MMLLVIVLVATGVVLGTGVYVTLRRFNDSDHPPVAVKPRHNSATTAQLKHFFRGKQCGSCSKPIPPVHAFELRPGLLNADTQQAIAWEDIPSSDLSATLESHVPICPNCVIIETFRQQHPEYVFDNQPTPENPSP